MKNKTKRVFWGFFSLDYKAMGEYLEEMAEKGWMVEKVGRYIAKFRAIKPKKIKFYVDVFKEGGPLTPEKTESSEEYRKLCQESGWTFITSQDYLQFFYADGDREPVQTDEEIEQKIVENTLVRTELRGVLIFAILAVYILVRNIPVRYTNLLRFTGVISAYLYPVLFIFTVVPALYSVIWMIKARRNIKNGLSITKPTLKDARRRIRAFYGPVWIIVLLHTLSFIIDAFFIPGVVVYVLLGPGIGIIFASSIRYLVKKNKISGDSVLNYIVIGTIILVIFIQAAGPSILEKTEEIYKVDSAPEGYPVITLEELSKESSPRGELRKEFRQSISPIVPKHYYYWDYEYCGDSSKSIRIKYYEAIKPYFADIIFKGITKELEKGMKWQGMTIFTKNIITDDEMRSLWDMDNLALTEERDELIIQKGNIVLHLDDYTRVMDFNDKETRELIINRFFQ